MLKIPNFEIAQIAIDNNGLIVQSMECFSSWVGKTCEQIIGQSFYQLVIDLDPRWKLVLNKNSFQSPFEEFLPLGSEQTDSSLGIKMVFCKYESIGVLSISPALAPHDSLKKAFLGDLMKDPRAIANTLIRLQKAESRLSDYISNFPGIFLPKDQISHSVIYLGEPKNSFLLILKKCIGTEAFFSKKFLNRTRNTSAEKSGFMKRSKEPSV